MSWNLKLRAAAPPLLAFVALSVLTVSSLHSQTSGIIIVPVGTEPRGLAIHRD